MMTVKTALDFYFSQFPKLQVNIEMGGGIRGHYHEETKASAQYIIDGWGDKEVARISCQTYTTFIQDVLHKIDVPYLYILYKD